MKAFYVLLLLTLIGIVFAKSTVDRKKVPYSKPPNSSHGDGNGGGNGPGNGAPAGPPSPPGGGPPSPPGGGLPSSPDGIGLVNILLKALCPLLQPLLASLGLGGLC